MAKRKCKMKVWNVSARVTTLHGRKRKDQTRWSRTHAHPTVTVFSCTAAGAKLAAMREYKRLGVKRPRGSEWHFSVGELGEHRGVPQDRPTQWW